MNEPHLNSQEEALGYVDTTLRTEWNEKLVKAGFEKVGPAQITEEITVDGRKAWVYFLEGMPVSMDARKYWLLDSGETVETSMQNGEKTLEEAYQTKYGRSLDAPSDEQLTQQAHALVNELDRTNGWATDERSRLKQDGPVGEVVTNNEVFARLTEGNGSWSTIKLTLTNAGTTTKYLAKPRVGLDSDIDGEYFAVEPGVPYLGIQAKREPYTNDELVVIEPNAPLSVNVDLSRLYDLSNVDQIRVRYQATHPLDGTGSDMNPITSNWLTLLKQ